MGALQMSNNYQDWEDDEDLELDNDSQEPNDLVKKLRKVDRAKEKRIKELESELGQLRSVQRESTIKSVLESKGVSPKIAKFIPSDLESTPEAVDNWIKENADIFGLVAKQEDKGPDLSALRQIDAITANAQSPAGFDDTMLRIDQASSAEEIINMINQQS